MPTSPEVTDFVEGAISSLKQADVVNASTAAKNAEALLRSAWQYVVATPELEKAFEDAVRASRDFGSAVMSGASYTITESDRIGQSIAVAAVEHFSAKLSDARPNDFAKALGLDWF